MGFAIPFVEACGAKLNPKEDFVVDFKKTKGIKLRIAIKNEIYKGNPKNRIDGFLPLA
jgi:hypothetical protein